MRLAHRGRLSALGVFSTMLLWGALAAADDDGFTPIFNGQTLEGWTGNMELWSVADGAITGTTSADKPIPGNTFLIWEGGTPSNFELRLSYKIVGGNSGIQYRSKVLDPDLFVVGGYQADIDSTPTYSGIVYEERARGILVDRGQVVRIKADGSHDIVGSLGDKAALQEKIKKEDWNDYVIVVRGNHIRHYINGVLMSELYDEQADAAATTGVLALQLHAGPPMTVQFKDLRIKELP